MQGKDELIGRFVSTVSQAYVVIAICGASWSLTNCRLGLYSAKGYTDDARGAFLLGTYRRICHPARGSS
jgi:hypothetical protein